MKLKAPLLLIDGDIPAYRCSAATDGKEYYFKYLYNGQLVTVRERYKKDIEPQHKSIIDGRFEGVTPIEVEYTPEPESHAIKLLKDFIVSLETDMKTKYGASDVRMEFYLSQGESFRNKIFPDYKMNRDGGHRPHHLNGLKQYLVNKHNAHVRPGDYEADDLVAMRSTQLTKAGVEHIIVSLDKDLMQIPGLHYNWVKKELVEVTEVQGLLSLYKQILMGDSTDGIPGIKGIGPKKAEYILKGLQSEKMMYLAALKVYVTNSGLDPETAMKLMHLTAQLVFLLRDKDTMWTPPDIGGVDA